MRNLFREEAAERSALLDVESYDVALDLTGDASGFGSTSVVRFACRQPGASTFADLDGTPLEVTLNGRTLEPVRDGARLVLPDLQADNELRVVARCSYSRTGEGLHRFVDPVDGLVYVWGQSALDDAQRMFACFDQPDLKAVFRLSVTAPDDWVVIGNGRGTRDGERWTFAETARMSTYLFSLAGGRWHGEQRVHDGIELGVWCRQSLAPHLEAEELFEITAQCFDSYHRTFRVRYAFGDTYDQIWVPELNFGAMENAGAVTFTEDLLFRSRVTQGARRGRAIVIAHEMAHMWFGNLATMRWWEDLWLNESFADLMGYWTTHEATRFDGAWTEFCTSRKAGGYRADQLPTTHPIADDVSDTRIALLNLDGISYAKGASVLRQLLALVGTETFFRGITTYLERHAFGNTTLPDFLRAMEEASGRDLTAWSEAWLRTPGVSTLRAQPDGIRQEAPVTYPVLREHRIEVGRYDLRDDGLVPRDCLPVDVVGELTPVELGDADLLLLNEGDLTFAKTRFDARSLTTVVAHLRELPDPLSRALCWASLWDTVRDAELAPRTFLDAVMANVEVESDPKVLEGLLRQATTAAVWSSDEQRVGALARDCLARAEAGSDLQLVWARGWVDATEDVAALDSLRAGAGPAGLAVDAELRWHVVRRLAALGALDDTDLDAELEQDATAAGQRHALVARAARPDAAAKERAWRAATTDTTLSNRESDALAEGFWQHGQADLCAPYVERYFTEIEQVWRSRSPEVARNLAQLLYPSVVLRPDVLDRSDAFLHSSGSLPAGLRRVVLEQQDDLRRAVAASSL